MADLPENSRHSSSSSTSSSDLSIRVERELVTGNGGSTKVLDLDLDLDLEGNNRDVANGVSVDSGSSSSSGVHGRGLSKVTTLPADISHADKLESSSSQFKLERSKTERQSLRPEDAAQIFDDKIPAQEKLKLLNRIATVKDDGTVEFEVPGDVEPEGLGSRSKHVHNVVDDPLETTDFHYIPPLNIVMLIVGTRGDVQPFIAIGKRLQIWLKIRASCHQDLLRYLFNEIK